jgi:hypothetical protein
VPASASGQPLPNCGYLPAHLQPLQTASQLIPLSPLLPVCCKIDSPVRSDGWPAVVGRGPPSLFRILTVHYCSTVAAICGLDRDYCARLLRNTYVAFRPSVYAVLSYAE